MLIAANHPNSFLDSILLNTIFKEPVWSLARGDVFKKPLYTRLLQALKIMPVYRTSEGVENLTENYKTFDVCISLFRNNGLVTIYSEGKCINEWHLRPLKKGTARLAIRTWEEKIPLKVLPVGINYSSFTRYGKNIFVNFGDIITADDIDCNGADGHRNATFNNKLQSELEKLVFEIPQNNRQVLKRKFDVKISGGKKMLLLIPAAVGWAIHLPLFIPVKTFVKKKTKNTDHYDSVLLAILLISYPLYLLLLTVLLIGLSGLWWFVFTLIILPVTARAWVLLKPL